MSPDCNSCLYLITAHIASTHSKSIGKLATKQARTLEVEFTLAPRNRAGESSRGSNRNNNHVDDEFEDIDSRAIVQHAPRQIDAQNEQEFPSLAGTSANTLSLRPSVSIRTKSFGPGGLARTKENFPALGGGSSDVSPVHNNNNGYKLGSASALFKNGNNQKSSGTVMIHLTNRPSTSNAVPKKSEVNANSAKDFPSLGRKMNLENDFIPLVPVNQSGVSAKHRSVVSQNYESAASTVSTKVGTVQRDATITTNNTKEMVPKLNSSNNFPALGNSTAAVTPTPWVTMKKQPTESRKSKVAPPPLAATKVESKPTASSSKNENKIEVKSSGKDNNKKDKVKSKGTEKKEIEPKKKSTKKTESKLIANNDFDEEECVPSPAVLSVVSAKHRCMINGYEPSVQSNSSKLQFVKRDSAIPSEKSPATVPKFNSANNFPSLSSNDSKFKETNNNNMSISFIDIMKNAKDSRSSTEPVNSSKPINPSTNDFSDITLSVPPPGFNDNSRKKQTQPPPGFSVTLNSVVKPTNNLTFTSSLGESYSILPTHHYLPPKNSTKRNKALFAHFQKNEEPEAVEQFKEISKMFIHGSYHALPYYEHCKHALKDKFDVIFPELLVLLPDISKQQVSDMF